MSNWSRAAANLGEPDLPVDAFQHVGDGRIKLHAGGGGGPSQTQTTQTTIPDYAKPYVQSALGKADALTSAPFQAYTGERTAQFTPLQQQAFAGAQGLGPSEYIAQSARMAQQPGQFGTEQAQQYMSPYMQNVVDIEKREAARQAGIAGLQQQAQAVGQGAFGGGRDAIMRAEAGRNLATQMGDIQSRGLQSAYTAAQNQFNEDMRRNLMASQQLGNLGGEQFRQQVGALGLQSQLGGQQQAQVQRGLDTRYQDFQAQLQHPYQQIGFMSDLFRGMPMSNTTQQIYAAPPSPISQLGGLALAGYGLTRAGGGEIPSGAGLADLAVQRMR